MNCTERIDVNTGTRLETVCSGVGDTIATKYVFIDTSVQERPVSIASTVHFGGSHVVDGLSPTTSPDARAKLHAQKALRDPALIKKIKQGVKDAYNVDVAESRIARACGDAASVSVEFARVIRDGVNPTKGATKAVTVAYTDVYAGEVLHVSPPVYVDGDITNASTRPDALESVLFHEGLHACFINLGIALSHHDLMDGVMGISDRCFPEDNLRCDPSREQEAQVEPLIKAAHSDLRWGMKGHTLIKDPRTGEEAIVFPSIAFRIPKDLSAADRKTIGYDAKEVHELWDGVISELHTVRDGQLMQEVGGPLFRAYGGALIQTTEAKMKSIGWLGGAKYINTLWKGAFFKLPRVPRDGTVVWESDGKKVGHRYVIYGGARFEIPNDATWKAMNYDALAPMPIWTGGLDFLPTIPGDGTMLRDAKNVYVIKNAYRVRLADDAAASKLGYRFEDARVLWPSALQAIPELPYGCDLEVVIDSVSKTTITAGDRNHTPLLYHVKNVGLAPSGKYVNIVGILDRKTWPNGHWQIVGPLVSSQVAQGTFALDAQPMGVGRHTISLAVKQDAPSCDTNATNDQSTTLNFVLAPDTTPATVGADLTVTLDSFSRSTFKVGSSIRDRPQVKYHVNNVGNVEAKSPVGQISIGLVIDGKDAFMGQLLIKTPLAAGSSKASTFLLTDGSTPIPVGHHTLQLKMDSVPGETNANNNVSNAIPFDVTP